jgi:hypothetical protein
MNVKDFRARVRVIHAIFGKGVVTKVEGDVVTVMFAVYGPKVLSLTFASEKFTRGRGRPPKTQSTSKRA